jgi:hypothetical protein
MFLQMKNHATRSAVIANAGPLHSAAAQCSNTGQYSAGLDTTVGQDRTKHDRTGYDTTMSQVRSGQVRAGKDRARLYRKGAHSAREQ